MNNIELEAAIKNAETISINAGERFTNPRRLVLECLLKCSNPQKAYDILSAISSNDRSVKPPTVYRALDFLTRLGIIHKIESDATYFVCSHANHCDHETHVPLFLICNDCGNVIENHLIKIEELIANSAQKAGFKADKIVIEARGKCLKCQ